MSEREPDKAVLVADAETHADAVYVSVHGDDCRVLVALIDRAAPQGKIVKAVRRELSRLGVPHRPVDPRIFQAIRLRASEGLSYPEVSVRVFGTPVMAERIRHWFNKWSDHEAQSTGTAERRD